MKVTEKEYKQLSEIGDHTPQFYGTPAPSPKNTMKGYAFKAIRVVRNGETIKERKLSFMALEVANGRADSAAFRRELRKDRERKRHNREMNSLT